MSAPLPTLRLVMADHLSETISSLRDCDREQDTVMLCEVMEEATSVPHHRKKIAFLFSAMRHFAEALRQRGFRVRYVCLDDPQNSGSFDGELHRAITETGAARLVLTEPGEYRVRQKALSWSNRFGIPVDMRPDDRFLCTLGDFAAWAEGRKTLRMEYFYRLMRQKTGILMDDNAPVGGQWNYDADNRKPAPDRLTVPPPYARTPDPITQEVLDLVARMFPNHLGDLTPFAFAVTRDDALDALDLFIRERLPRFGDYQDAMVTGQPWMFHSHLSFYLNCGLLLPLECLQAAEAAYRAGAAPLNAVEGFVRQILGWREYVRGLYWLKMPGYAQENALNAHRPLPAFYWDGQTQMNCLHHCITETWQNAYAHHIQRLMVLGNFALLAGLDPAQVNEWYLAVYADAFEWVEMPNVSGMILFADGGLLASKPYAAGGNYINKMSDYCGRCRYKISKKNGPEACPFHYLYWDFLARNRSHFGNNPRLAMAYRTYDRMGTAKHQAIQDDSARFLRNLTPTPPVQRS